MRTFGTSLCVEDMDTWSIPDVQRHVDGQIREQGMVVLPARWAFRTLWVAKGEHLPKTVVCEQPERMHAHDHILVRATVDRTEALAGWGKGSEA